MGYINKLSVEGIKYGKFTLDEDTAILEHLFTNKPRGINTIDGIDHSSFDNITEVKRIKHSLLQRFHTKLKPIILSYHLGTLNSNWNYDFFEHLVTQNYNALKEIPWDKLRSLYPAETNQSLMIRTHSAVKTISKKHGNMSFSDALKEHLKKIKGSYDYTELQKDYHTKIVNVYCKCSITKLSK